MKNYRKLNKMMKCNKKKSLLSGNDYRVATLPYLHQTLAGIINHSRLNYLKSLKTCLNFWLKQKKSHLKGKLNMVGSAATIFLCQICCGLLKWFDLSMAAESD